MKSNDYKEIWIKLVNEKFHDPCYEAIAVKLKRVKFDKHGEMKLNEVSLYVKKHFPHLVNVFRIRLQAVEIPKRKDRTRLEHHPVRQKQMVLGELNQLDLF